MSQVISRRSKSKVELQLDAVQVGMFTDLATVMDLSYQLPVIKEIVVEKRRRRGMLNLCSPICTPCHVFCSTLTKEGFNWDQVQKGEILNVQVLQDFCQNFPILLGIGVATTELKSMLELLQPLGLNLLGGEEEKIGVKSFDAVDEIFEHLSLG
ncbi:MAG: hypothetical protein IPO07_01470 [Haliscomenobacter sp.]|nr:hypothetical protein [Haliscomenobacter sp.]MBK9487583.1 hypothetical protein [Haliscomenobacter sp.]